MTPAEKQAAVTAHGIENAAEVECPQCSSKTSIRAHGLERPDWCGVCGIWIGDKA